MQLHGIIVHGPNGTVYDLSSAFNPDVDDYGTSVPPSFVNGSLCILPGNGEAPAEDIISVLSLFWCAKCLVWKCPACTQSSMKLNFDLHEEQACRRAVKHMPTLT